LGAVLPGRSHCPALLQHPLLARGNIKNCEHDTQPPQSRAAIMKPDSIKFEKERNTIYQP